MPSSFRSLVLLPLVLALTLAGCKSKEKFPSLGEKIASPVDVAASDQVSDGGKHFYVLNADFDRTYNQGSIVVLDTAGNKVGKVATPRMGRVLVVAGTDMLATYDFRDDGEEPMAQLFDISTPETPVLKAEWSLVCSPFGATMVKGYDHFAISCTGGQIYIGTLTADRAQTQLKLVRDFDVARRALYIDPKRELLFAFPSDPTQKEQYDHELVDSKTYDEKPSEVLVDDKSVPNEVPDDLESTKRVANDKSRRHVYQFVIYDIKAERADAPGCVVTEDENCAFPFRDQNSDVPKSELHFVYFRLSNFDGTPDGSDKINEPNFADIRYYRTNFWEAKPDPTDPDVFYLSHRGRPDTAPHANQIVRVTLIDDPRTPKIATDHLMTFERVYGFRGQGVDKDGNDSSKYQFPSDFEVENVSGQKLLVVNHFRDLVNWVKDDRFFALSAAVVDDFTWFSEVRGKLSAGEVTSYYQVAMNQDGLAATCSFYGNAVILMQITPGIGMKTVTRVE